MMHRWQRGGLLAIGLEMDFDQRLDEHILERASVMLLDAEPILGCQLVVDAPTPHWRMLPASARHVLRVTNASAEYDEIGRGGLDATQNVQVAICLFRHDDGDRLLIRMTHEVGDGAGLQYLALRLSAIYSALCLDPTHQPAANRAVDRDLTQVLSQLPTREYPRIIWDFVRFLAPRVWPRRTHGLPLPDQSAGSVAAVVRRLSSSQVAFLSTFGRSRGSTLNDMFLAAAYRALASYGRWDGTSALRIAITVNLRRWCPAKDNPGPICNLSAFECPFLVRNLGRDFESTLANVRSVMAQRKRSRPGFALTLLSRLISKLHTPAITSRDEQTAPTRQSAPERGITFSNEGALDAVGVCFGPLVPVSAHVIPPFFALPWLHISLSGYRGALTLLSVTSDNGRAIVEGFFDALLDELPRESGAALWG
jgi:NRPS condensation-like uncharacterized protein